MHVVKECLDSMEDVEAAVTEEDVCDSRFASVVPRTAASLRQEVAVLRAAASVQKFASSEVKELRLQNTQLKSKVQRIEKVVVSPVADR